MDEQRKQNNSIFNQIYSSKKAIHLLLSLSLLAFISSPYFSQLSASLSSITLFSTDRHYVFLLCNIIMLLVFKSSGLFATTSSPPSDYHVARKIVHEPTHFTENIHVKNNLISQNQFGTTDFDKNYVKLQIHDVLQTKTKTNAAIIDEVEEARKAIVVLDPSGEYVTSIAQYEVNDHNLVNKHKEEEEEDEEEEEEEEEEKFVNIKETEEQVIMICSTEELNKKCDDFIRKMKYGIKFEAQLITV